MKADRGEEKRGGRRRAEGEMEVGDQKRPSSPFLLFLPRPP